MDKLTEDAVQEIEQIHSSWIEFEVAGDNESMLALCADDIELWPPDVQPVCGRAAVSAQLAHGTTRIHGN
jgi:ketosteroid isomerase-like protein